MTSTNKSAFTITLQLGDKTLKGSGATAVEALSSLPRPQKITTKAILTITNGKAKGQRVLTPPQAKRLFYPLARLFLAKQLVLGLK